MCTHARVIVLLSNGDSTLADAELGGRKRRWWIDHVNILGRGDSRALRREVRRWELSVRKALFARGGPQEVAGLDRMVSAAVIGVLIQMTDHRPAPEFRDGWREVPGGGWEPRPGATNIVWP
jgi:hypothetical protein